MKELQRIVGLFAYYAQCIMQYSDKIKPLPQNCTFPLRNDALKSFNPIRPRGDRLAPSFTYFEILLRSSQATIIKFLDFS